MSYVLSIYILYPEGKVYPYYYLWTYFAHRSAVFIVDFLEVNSDWEEILSIFYRSLVHWINSFAISVFNCNYIFIALSVVIVISHEITTVSLVNISLSFLHFLQLCNLCHFQINSIILSTDYNFYNLKNMSQSQCNLNNLASFILKKGGKIALSLCI